MTYAQYLLRLCIAAFLVFSLPSFAGEYRISDGWLVEGSQTILTGDVAILSAGNSIELANSASLTIQAGGQLLIEPGATIRAGQASKINVYGELIAEGTEGNEIVFTSSLDAPIAGSWQGVWAYAGASVKWRHVNVQYANYGLYAHVNASNSNVTVDVQYSRFSNNIRGVYIYEESVGRGAVPILNYNRFSDNSYHLYAWLYLGSDRIVDARFNWWGSAELGDIRSKIFDRHDNPKGMLVNYGGYLSSTDLTDIDLTRIAVQWPSSLLVEQEYQLSGSYSLVGSTSIAATQVVRVTSGSTLTVDAGATLTIAAGGKFIIDEGATLNIETGANFSSYGRWEIAPGATVKIGIGIKLDVFGELIAEGTEGNEIVFTSSVDAPIAGSWQGVWAYAGASVKWRHVNVQYANYGLYAHVNASNSNVTVDVQYSRFSNNIRGVYIYEESVGRGAVPILNYNRFSDNSYHLYAWLYLGSDRIVDARFNWWGSAELGDIRSKIFDRHDNPKGMLVNYGGYLSSTDLTDIDLTRIAVQWPSSLLVEQEYQLSGSYSLVGSTSIAATQVVRVTSGSTLTVDAGATLTIAAGGKFIIDEGATLNIETGANFSSYGRWEIAPGATVKIGIGIKLDVFGELIAEGTEGNEIVFTSSVDAPIAGSWQGVWAYAGASVKWRHVNVQYANYGLYAHVNASNSNVTVDVQYSRFSNNIRGVYIYEESVGRGAVPILNYNRFSDNSYHLYAWLYLGSDRIVDARFNWWGSAELGDIRSKIFDRHDNPKGMLVNYGGYLSSTDLTDIDLTRIAVQWPSSLLVEQEYQLSGSYSLVGSTSIAATQVVRVTSGSTLTVDAGATLTIAAGGKFIIDEGATLNIETGANFSSYGRWEIAPGATVKIGIGIKLDVFGELIAEGTEGNEIVFTSSVDAPIAGSWQGVWAYAGASVKWRHVNVQYANYGLYAHVNASNSNVTVDVQYSRFSNNIRGVYIYEESVGRGAVPILNYNRFSDNSYHLYAWLYLGSDRIVDARFNWWGSAELGDIRSKIFDRHDNPKGMLVNYGGYLSSTDLTDIDLTRIAVQWPSSLLVEQEYQLSGSYSLVGSTSIAATQVVRVTSGSTLTVDAGATLTIAAGGKFIIDEGATLNIETGANFSSYGRWEIAPGATVKIGIGIKLDVFGELIAEGTEGNEIVFTSSVDAPIAGSWQGVWAYAGASVKWRHVNVQYANYGLYAHVNASNSNVTVDVQYSRFSNNIRGVYIYEESVGRGAVPILNYNRFSDNSYHLYAWLYLGSDRIVDARFNWWGSAELGDIRSKIFDRHDNPKGMLVNYGGYLSSTDLTDIDLTRIAVQWPSSLLVEQEYQLSGSYSLVGSTSIAATQVVRVTSGSTLTVDAGATLTIAAGGKFIIDEGATLNIETGANFSSYGRWEIAPGATVKIGIGIKLDVFGELIAEGTEGNEIVFTSSVDAPIAGSWQGVWAYAGASVKWRHVNVQYANYGLYAHVNASNSNVTVDVQYSRFSNNIRGVYIYEESVGRGAVPILNYNRFSDNSYHLYAWLYLGSDRIVDARFNWWGSAELGDIRSKIFDRHDNPKGMLVDISAIRLSQDINDIVYFIDKDINDAIVSQGDVFISQSLSIAASASLTLSSGNTLRLSDGVKLVVEGDLIIEEGSTLDTRGSGSIEVRGNLIVRAKNFVIPENLTITVTAGSHLYASIGTQITLEGHLIGLGSETALAYIGLEDSAQGQGTWLGIIATANSQLHLKYAHIAYAETAIYMRADSDVSIEYSRLTHNRKAVHVYLDKHVDILKFKANYNVFHENLEFNIYAEQTQAKFYGLLLDAKFNWWGSQDVGRVNAHFYDRSDSASLGLWIDFGSLWLDQTGTVIMSSAFVGNIDTAMSLNSKLTIVGYSELNADLSIEQQGHLVIAASAVLNAKANILVAESAKLELETYAHLIVDAQYALTMNADTSLVVAAGAKVEIYGKLLALGQANKPIIITGGEPQICL